MTDIYEELRESERKRSAAESAFHQAKRAVERAELKFREALPVSRNHPCAVAITSGGKVVVHVFVESASNPNQLYIGEPEYLTDDAKPRKKFANEQLGVSS